MIRYIGLDFEASGADPWGRHAPIQIGMAAFASNIGRLTDAMFESLIGGWNFARSNGDYEWNEVAAKVHNIPEKMVASGTSSAPKIHEVDVRAATWMYDHGFKNRMWNVTVGWNVAGYDRQFITRHMPNLNQLLSYRTVDLNALVFSLAGDSEARFKQTKTMVRTRANEYLGIDETDRHDALTDARAALVEFKVLRELIANGES